jgi:NuA3 HAT complex component NTO1
MRTKRRHRKDKNHIFRDPVSKVEVPDYFDIIKDPMSWSVIDAKLDKHEYWSLQAFKV